MASAKLADSAAEIAKPKKLLAEARACLKNAFRQMYVTVCGRFVPNEGGVGGKGIKGNALRRLNAVQISRKVGRIDGGNDFSNTL